jgi:hypothetical protein
MSTSYTLDDLESDQRHFRDLIDIAVDHHLNGTGNKLDSLLWIIRDEGERMVGRVNSLRDGSRPTRMTGGQRHG